MSNQVLSKNDRVYSVLAPIYDRIMSHVNYDDWFDMITSVIERYGPSDPAILELGAGTAVLGARLRERGFRYIASDLSYSMCRCSTQRGCRPLCLDARHLPFKSHFDLILFLYDGINYFPDLQDYLRFFRSTHACLSTNGLLLFDVTTVTNSLRYFNQYLDFEDFGDFSYVRTSFYDANDSIQHNDFVIYRRVSESAHLYERHHEHHVQRVFDPREIADSIPRELFEVIGVFDGFSFRKHSSKSERVHFLLRAKSS